MEYWEVAPLKPERDQITGRPVSHLEIRFVNLWTGRVIYQFSVMVLLEVEKYFLVPGVGDLYVATPSAKTSLTAPDRYQLLPIQQPTAR